MNNHLKWPYIISSLFIVCSTVILAISLITNRPLPDAILYSGVGFMASIVSFIFAAVQTNRVTNGQKKENENEPNRS